MDFSAQVLCATIRGIGVILGQWLELKARKSQRPGGKSQLQCRVSVQCKVGSIPDEECPKCGKKFYFCWYIHLNYEFCHKCYPPLISMLFQSKIIEPLLWHNRDQKFPRHWLILIKLFCEVSEIRFRPMNDVCVDIILDNGPYSCIELNNDF
jgi:hypothetical protein